MEWRVLHLEVANRGWTLKFSAAHFPGGISGVKIELAPFDPDEEPIPIDEIVRVDELEDESRDHILDATLRLCRRIDPGF